MPIDFFSLLDDKGWRPLPYGQTNGQDPWADGGVLYDAPVDVRATFKDAMWVTDKMDPSFKMRGMRCKPNFTIPRRQHNQQKLVIVFGGEWNVDYVDENGKEATEKVVGPGGFIVIEENTPHTMTAGPDGVSYTEQWDYHPKAALKTTWHDEGWAVRKT